MSTPDLGQNPQITLVGCGGTGGFTAEALCRLFTGRQMRLLIMDDDLVEPHNLLRQNFHHQDTGRPKAQAMAERLSQQYQREIGYCLQRFGRQTEISYENIWRHRNQLIIMCVDNPGSRREMAQNLAEQGSHAWLIDAGNDRDWGQVLVGNTHTLEDYPTPAFHQATRTCRAVPSPYLQRPDLTTAVSKTAPDLDCAAALDLTDQDPTINQMMAMLITQVVRRMAANNCTFMGLYLDLQQGTMNPRQINPENLSEATGIPREELIGETA